MHIIEIESKDSNKIKELRKLGLKKYRKKTGMFIVENFKIIQDGLENNFYFEDIIVTKSFLAKNEDELKRIVEKNNNLDVFLIADKLNKAFSALETPSGVCAVYNNIEKEINLNKSIVYLNGINDPGNLGTILRSALALGIENVVLDETCVDLYNSKTIQAAKDAIFKLNIVFDENRKIAREIKEKMAMYVTNVEKGEDVSLVFQPQNKACIVLGNESLGVSKDLEEMADKFINIKTTSKIESLNVAISAGIIFHELFKRNTLLK